MKYYLISILFILGSCNAQKKVNVKNSSTQDGNDTSLVLLLQDEYGAFDVEETMVIKDQKRLKSFYSKINRTRKPGLSVPEIDFSKEMIVIQCSGNQNNTGLPTLSFKSETSTKIVLDSKFERDSNEASTTVMTNPFCVYKMPLTKKEVVVELNHE